MVKFRSCCCLIVLLGALSAELRAEQTLDARALAQVIDRAIERRLDEAGLQAADSASDAEFLRRAYLDIAGIIPPADKVIAFLDSTDPDRRGRLIDNLLADPRYGLHMADVWLFLLAPDPTYDHKGPRLEPLRRWLEDGFNKNTPWNQMVFELLSATGDMEKNGAVRYYMTGRRRGGTDSLVPLPNLIDSVSGLFLGAQLKCAQCHNHPFADWKRSEYWGIAGFFTNVAFGKGYQIIDGPTANSRDGFIDEDVKPRLTAASFLRSPMKDSAGNLGRRDFAEWATAADNPYFARAAVNRVWAHFFGRGLVNPLDDLRDDNPPSHPELLRVLSEQFAASGFDLHYLIRAICNSQAYQRSSRSISDENDDDDSAAVLLARMPMKVLSSEQIYDSLSSLFGETRVSGGTKGSRFKLSRREGFVDFFRNPDADPTAYNLGMGHRLRLMNSPEFATGMADFLRRTTQSLTEHQAVGRLGKAVPHENIERLYLAILARRPTSEESERMTAFVQRPGADPQTAYRQVLWVLLQSSEFVLNH